MNKILEVIDSQSNTLAYTKENFTLKPKLLIYEAFKNIYKSEPDLMSSYLLDNSRKGKFQHKLFIEYVRLLETSLPFSIRKNRKQKTISNLLDEDLNIFDGISEFTGKLDSKLRLDNGTKELYVGSRKATYILPFYIGKVISARDKANNCILNKIDHYNFNYIQFKDLSEQSIITLKHLRVVPHYQMGAMTHINRIRKLIVDELKQSI